MLRADSLPAAVLSISPTLSHFTLMAPCKWPLRTLVRLAALRPRGSLSFCVPELTGPTEVKGHHLRLIVHWGTKKYPGDQKRNSGIIHRIELYATI